MTLLKRVDIIRWGGLKKVLVWFASNLTKKHMTLLKLKNIMNYF